MFYSVLTDGTPPFEKATRPETAPGETLRVADGAIVLQFPVQPIQIFCERWARGFGKVLWNVNGVRLHPDDIEDIPMVKSTTEFRDLCRRFDKVEKFVFESS